MRVLMFAALTVVLVGSMFSGTAHAREKMCKTGDGNGYNTQDVREAIWCAVRRWPVPGGFVKALQVASCESGGDLLDYSHDGYAGTFQQSTEYWPGRRARHNQIVRWPAEVGPSVYWPRNNVLVSIRMIHASQSWNGWACA